MRESGLQLNKRCQYPEGIKIDPSKTEAITEMFLPGSVNELQRFLGMVNFLGKFTRNLCRAYHSTTLPPQKRYCV